MRIGQYIYTEDLSEWYADKYGVELHIAEDFILDWMGMFDNGNVTAVASLAYAKKDEQWIKDLFLEFPELNGRVLIWYND